jgi:hypothetical protein
VVERHRPGPHFHLVTVKVGPAQTKALSGHFPLGKMLPICLFAP